MARIRPTDADLIKTLTDLGKSYFTVSDLERILELPRKSLYVVLGRLVKSGVLERLGKNIYTVFTRSLDVEKVANEIYFPCYLSFEKALSACGILSQIPFVLTFASPRPPKKMTIAGTMIEFTHLPKKLYFGYKLEGHRYVAEPEKALLDQLYMVSREKRTLNTEELDLTSINKERLYEYAKKFPAYTRKLLSKSGLI